MSEVHWYVHHGSHVAVRTRLEGKHREHCLCYICDWFHPEDRENNCRKANLLYALDSVLCITTPVWECSTYKPKPTPMKEV